MSKGHRSQIKKERNAVKDNRPFAQAKHVRLSDTKASIRRKEKRIDNCTPKIYNTTQTRRKSDKTNSYKIT